MLRMIAILALAIAGFIRSPFFPAEITNVPAHELFYSVLGAMQLVLALYLLTQPKKTPLRLGLLISGSSLGLALLSSIVDAPFTNTAFTSFNGTVNVALLVAFIADAVAFAAFLRLLMQTTSRRFWQMSLGASGIIGVLIWGAALIAEPYLPDLAHSSVNQFEVFDQSDRIDYATGYEWDLPVGFPVPAVPEDNLMTYAKVELGRYLFYDTRLSGNETMACSSCHHQELAFTDALVVPVGSTGESHVRNSQSLTNVAYNATYTWGNPVLTEIEKQVVIPMFGEFPIEMGILGNEEIVLDRLRNEALYQRLFGDAYPDEEEPVTFHNVVQALSSFVRTLISGDSPYDQFVYQGDRDALSESALRGLDMFLSEKFECHHCHGGFNFTLSTRHANTTFPEQPFFNTGLYNIDGEGSFPRGNRGVFDITGNPEDMGRFRPPSLRNVELTAPYMHDGSIATLEDVIRFYADGGRVIEEGELAGDGRTNPYKSAFVPGFEITDQEMIDLIAFLKSLTDTTFITTPQFSNPFEG